MNTPWLAPLLQGALISALLFIWKKGSQKWTHWLPIIRKGVEIGLKLAIGSVVLYAAYKTFSASDPVMDALWTAAGALGFAVILKKAKLLDFTKKEKIKRGTTLVPASDVKRQVFKKSKKNRLHIGEVPIPDAAEPYHFLIAGATGTGKSVAINHILKSLRAANDTVILVDSGGDFLSKHFEERTDFVLNPFDNRCVNWSPLLEMRGEWDAEALARSMIPDGTGESKEWNSYAQTLVASLLRKLWTEDRLNLEDLLYYALTAPIPELKEFLEGTASVAQMSSEKTFGSIRTIVSNYLNPYSYLPAKGNAFSVSEMIDAEHSGFLFLTYRDDQLDSLRSLIACILDVAARSILSLKPDPNRRIWLVIDEFASIGRVQSVEAVATKARKVGGCLLVGLQTVSQLRDRYGEHSAQTILSCLSTWLVLRCADADTAEYMSKYVGDVELIRQSKSSNTSESGDSQGKSEQQTTQRAVLPSEIQALENLHGYLKIAGGYPLCEVQLDTKSLNLRDGAGEPFVKRDVVAKPLIKFSSLKKSQTPTVETRFDNYQSEQNPYQEDIPSKIDNNAAFNPSNDFPSSPQKEESINRLRGAKHPIAAKQSIEQAPRASTPATPSPNDMTRGITVAGREPASLKHTTVLLKRPIGGIDDTK